ncbi:hypothetical protein JX265_009495 [Neoarthrinium moseri]|uniref:Uncharacterized protein n=1 Tax=Neoarthrinium moseri TaxID=1658444 RepID=A0A9P9WFX0_9PEZI|nr:hypothetical protein JX265_009495 [Neoarthrinium moseri]
MEESHTLKSPTRLIPYHTNHLVLTKDSGGDVLHFRIEPIVQTLRSSCITVLSVWSIAAVYERAHLLWLNELFGFAETMKLLPILLPVLAWAGSLAPPLGVCVSEPLLALDAGISTVSTIINDDSSHRCQASMDFADPSFLVLSYLFEPFNCTGSRAMSFVVPEGVPNGRAFITWSEVDADPSNVSGGSGDPALELRRTGTVGCVTAVAQTSTNLVTTAFSSTTLVETVPVTFTTTSTSYLPSSSSVLPPPVTVTQTITGAVFTSQASDAGTAVPTDGVGQSTGKPLDAKTEGGPGVPTSIADTAVSIDKTRPPGQAAVSTSSVTSRSTSSFSNNSTSSLVQTTLPSTELGNSPGGSTKPAGNPTTTGAGTVEAASVFEQSSGTRMSVSMVTLSVVSTLTVFHTVRSCTMSVQILPPLRLHSVKNSTRIRPQLEPLKTTFNIEISPVLASISSVTQMSQASEVASLRDGFLEVRDKLTEAVRTIDKMVNLLDEQPVGSQGFNTNRSRLEQR